MRPEDEETTMSGVPGRNAEAERQLRRAAADTKLQAAIVVMAKTGRATHHESTRVTPSTSDANDRAPTGAGRGTSAGHSAPDGQ